MLPSQKWNGERFIHVEFHDYNCAWFCRKEEVHPLKETSPRLLMLSSEVWISSLRRWMQRALACRDPAGWYGHYWPNSALYILLVITSYVRVASFVFIRQLFVQCLWYFQHARIIAVCRWRLLLITSILGFFWAGVHFQHSLLFCGWLEVWCCPL